MMEVKRLLLEEVRTRLYARLKGTASVIVKEIVQREIAERVRKQVNTRGLRRSHDIQSSLPSTLYSSKSRSRS